MSHEWWHDEGSAAVTWGPPYMDAYGNLVQEGSNGQVRVLNAADAPARGSTPSINITNPGSVPAAITTIYDDAGYGYSYNELTGETKPIMLPGGGQLRKAQPPAIGPGQPGDNGINPYTKLPWDVVPDPGSPSGFTYTVTGEAVFQNGAAYTGAGKPKTRRTGVVQTSDGSDVLVDLDTGETIKVVGGPSASARGGGGSDPMSSMVTAQINAQARAASDAASAARQAASAQASAEADSARFGFQSAEAEKSRQFAREQQESADALRVALERPGYELARRQFQLQMQGRQLEAAKMVADLISTTDPGAYAAFLEAGGGSIANAIAGGGNAVSDKANLGAARALRASEQPIDLPPTWEELFPSAGALRLGGGGIPSGGTTSAAGGNASPTGATNVATTVPDPAKSTVAARIDLKPGWSPVPAMQSTFDFTQYGGPRVDLGEMPAAAMTRLLGPGGGFYTDSAADPRMVNASTGGPGGISPAFPIQEAAPTVLPGIAGGSANPFATIPEAERAALLAGGGLSPEALANLTALAPRKAMGGFATDPAMMVGDARANDPRAGGAKPEVVLNPTGAPLMVIPSDGIRMGRGMGMPRYANSTWLPFDPDTSPRTPEAQAAAYYASIPAYSPAPPQPAYTAPAPAPVYTQPAPAPAPSAAPSATTMLPPPPTFQNTSPGPLTTPAPAPATTMASPPPPARSPLNPGAGMDLRPGGEMFFQNTSPVSQGTPVTATPASAFSLNPGAGMDLRPGGEMFLMGSPGGLQAPAAAAIPTDIITPEDRAYLDRIGAIRAGAQYPELNPYATNFWYQDPTVREMFLKGRQTKLGIPLASSVWDAQRYAIPGISRGSLRIGR